MGKDKDEKGKGAYEYGELLGKSNIHLGDFALGSKTKVKETKEKLNWLIILIKGNHDKVIKDFIVVRDSIQIGKLLFSHRPIPRGVARLFFRF